jgi:hypothetical protein
VLLAAACLLAAADTAVADTTQIGSVAETAGGLVPAPITSGGFGVQVGESAGSYAVPPGYGTITAWTHSAGGTPGSLTFKVYRPTGAPKEFLVVGSDTQAITPGAVQSFPVQIAVQPGDRIGLSSDDVELAYNTNDLGDQIGFYSGDLPVGTTRAYDGEAFPDYKLDVVATLTNDSPPPATDPAGAGALPAGASRATAPKLTRLSLSPGSFAAARSGSSTRSTSLRGFGARVRYRVDRAASVRFSVQRVSTGRRTGRGASARCVRPTNANRSAPRCTRYVAIGSFSKSARAGAVTSFTFTGRLGGRALERGSYRLTATARSGSVVGNSLARTFRIVR